MRSLIKFELKKMLTRRVAIVANVGMPQDSWASE